MGAFMNRCCDEFFWSKRCLEAVHLVGVLFFDQIAIEAFLASFSSELSFTHLQRRIDLRALLANAISCTLGTKHFVALQALPITGFMG